MSNEIKKGESEKIYQFLVHRPDGSVSEIIHIPKSKLTPDGLRNINAHLNEIQKSTNLLNGSETSTSS